MEVEMGRCIYDANGKEIKLKPEITPPPSSGRVVDDVSPIAEVVVIAAIVAFVLTLLFATGAIK
jgi:hypothetical protein